jgi:hypothetical protein
VRRSTNYGMAAGVDEKAGWERKILRKSRGCK